MYFTCGSIHQWKLCSWQWAALTDAPPAVASPQTAANSHFGVVNVNQLKLCLFTEFNYSVETWSQQIALLWGKLTSWKCCDKIWSSTVDKVRSCHIKPEVHLLFWDFETFLSDHSFSAPLYFQLVTVILRSLINLDLEPQTRLSLVVGSCRPHCVVFPSLQSLS